MSFSPAPAAPAGRVAGSRVAFLDVRKGDRPAITMKDGRRLTAIATAKAREARGVNLEIPLKDLESGRYLGRIEGRDIASIIWLG